MSRAERAWRERAGPWGAALGAAGALFTAVFLLYFLVYRVRHFSLPLGWDTPWYVWRAEFVAAEGLGPLGTAARPGHALLSAVLGSATGLSQLELQVVVPFVLVGAFALGIGALAAEGIGGGWGRWAVAAATAGALVGATRLVGENVANLQLVVLAVAGSAFLVRMVAAGRGFWGASLLLVAAGLAHWLFLGLVGVVLGVWFLLALPASLRQRRTGVPLLRTEAGATAAVAATVGASMAAIVYGVLGTTLSTFEIREARRRFVPKLTEDLSNLRAAALLPVAAVGGAALEADRRASLRQTSDGGSSSLGQTSNRSRARGAFLRLLAAWTLVFGGGLVYALITLDLPPHRFLTLLVAVPVIMGIGAAVLFAARWAGRRAGRAVGAGLATAAIVALSIPGIVVWYGPADIVDGAVVTAPAEGPEQWFDEEAFEQARAAGAFAQALPEGEPLVFVVSPLGASGPVSVALKERTIRAALPPERQEDVHVFPGSPEDLLAGRRTRVENPEFDRAIGPYWRDVRPVLDQDPTVFFVEALGRKEHEAAVDRLGAAEIAPGTAVLGAIVAGGPGPPEPLRPVPATEVGVLWAVLLVAALGIAGLGWTLWFAGPGVSALTVVSLSPAVGAGMLSLGALVAAEAGLRLGGPAGMATLAAVATAGVGLATVSARKRG